MAKKTTTKSKGVNITPLHNKVLIAEIGDVETKTASGIFLPENAKDKSGLKRGLVVSVGPGKFDDGERVPMQVKVGDKVLFSWGDTVSIDSKEYYLVSENEISAIIE